MTVKTSRCVHALGESAPLLAQTGMAWARRPTALSVQMLPSTRVPFEEGPAVVQRPMAQSCG
jgi:hypothetical protein